MSSAAFHEVTGDRAEEFVARGYKLRHFFPHRIRRLPKCGPDAFRIAASMCGTRDPDAHWELVLYAREEVIEDLPREVFFDDEVIWHQQQFGRLGQVATASVVVESDCVSATVLVSDLVQRISRRRDLKTHVEKRFKGWVHMLLNAILAFALDRGVHTVRIATAELALAHTDPRRTVGPELYRRIYDRAAEELLPVRRENGWWVTAVDPSLVVRPERRSEPLPPGRTICICHDIEYGRGHLDVDPDFAASAEESSPRSLEAMLAVEAEMGSRATYNVLGLLFGELRSEIAAGGHGLAFHSYDHEVDGTHPVLDRLHWAVSRVRGSPRVDPRDARQLNRCRAIDYRIKGYRPPRSRVGAELTDANLLFHNFEWLASSRSALGLSEPRLEHGVVKVPIAIDDYDLHRRRISYDIWEEAVVDRLREGEFGAVCLHDCYGPLWLPRYRGLLEQIHSLGRVVTMDELAAEVTLASAS